MKYLTNQKLSAILTSLLLNEKTGFGDSEIQGAGYALSLVHGFFYAYHFMVGVMGGFRACRFLDPVRQPVTSTAQSLATSVGSKLFTIKELPRV